MFFVRPVRLLGLTALSFMLTAGSFILGAVPMRWMEQRYGLWVTGLCHLSLAGLLLAFGQAEFSLVIVGFLLLVLSFSYFERELPGRSKFWLGGLSIIFSGGVCALLLGAWGALHGIGHLQLILETTRQRWMDVTTLVGTGSSALASEQIIRLMPGVFLSCWIAALILAVLFESAGQPARSRKAPVLALTFKVPDIFVFLTIGAVFGTFYIYEGYEALRLISENVLLVCAFLYLVQGMAIVTTFVNVWRVPLFARLVLFFLLFINFFIVAILGFSDYWIEYRRRFLFKKKEN